MKEKQVYIVTDRIDSNFLARSINPLTRENIITLTPDAFYVLKGTDKVWGSSISDLAEDCIAIDPTFDFLKSYGPILDKYLYSTRYPTFSLSGSPYEIFTKEDSNKAKELSGDVIKFCDEKVKDQG